MFIPALLTIVKTWERPKCSFTDEWIKMRYMYTKECYSVIKMNEIVILSEISQRKTNFTNSMDATLSEPWEMGQGEPWDREAWDREAWDREAWRAAIHGVAKSRTRLSD